MNDYGKEEVNSIIHSKTPCELNLLPSHQKIMNGKLRIALHLPGKANKDSTEI